jgi:hypothetical protein
VRILTEPDASLTTQYKALMNTENVDVKFAQDGVRRLAEIAFSVNEKTENIGARRLHTVMERLLESVSFDASENGGSAIEIDAAYVDRHTWTIISATSPRTKTSRATSCEDCQADTVGDDTHRRGLGSGRGLEVSSRAGFLDDAARERHQPVRLDDGAAHSRGSRVRSEIAGKLFLMLG